MWNKFIFQHMKISITITNDYLVATRECYYQNRHMNLVKSVLKMKIFYQSVI